MILSARWLVVEAGIFGTLAKSGAKRLGKSVGKIGIDNNKPEWDVHKAVEELPQDVGVHRDYVQYLLDHVYSKDEVRTVSRYVRSAAAGNLSAHERADLVIAAAEKLKYLDIVRQFFI